MIKIIICIAVLAILLYLIWSLHYFRKMDYSDLKNWIMYQNDGEKAVDCFLVCPTVEKGLGGNWIADALNPEYRVRFKNGVSQLAGIFSQDCNIYAPMYRQMSFHGYKHKDYDDYTYIPYVDVRRAFLEYLKTNKGKPFIIAGFSQGADMAIGLTAELDWTEYNDQLIACYGIGWRLLDKVIAAYPNLRPAQGETDTGVVINYNSEAEETRNSLMVPKGTKSHCINPLNWRTDSQFAPKELNKGAVFLDKKGNIREEIPQFCGAYIDAERGVLKVPGLDTDKYSYSFFDRGVYHLYDFQFFYRNLQENVGKRINAYMEISKK